MKIIRCDNFARENQPEHLVAENIENEREAKVMLEALQAMCTDNGPNWYRLVEDDYRLSRGMADLI